MNREAIKIYMTMERTSYIRTLDLDHDQFQEECRLLESYAETRVQEVEQFVKLHCSSFPFPFDPETRRTIPVLLDVLEYMKTLSVNVPIVDMNGDVCTGDHIDEIFKKHDCKKCEDDRVCVNKLCKVDVETLNSFPLDPLTQDLPTIVEDLGLTKMRKHSSAQFVGTPRECPSMGEWLNVRIRSDRFVDYSPIDLYVSDFIRGGPLARYFSSLINRGERWLRMYIAAYPGASRFSLNWRNQVFMSDSSLSICSLRLGLTHYYGVMGCWEKLYADVTKLIFALYMDVHSYDLSFAMNSMFTAGFAMYSLPLQWTKDGIRDSYGELFSGMVDFRTHLFFQDDNLVVYNDTDAGWTWYPWKWELYDFSEGWAVRFTDGDDHYFRFVNVVPSLINNTSYYLQIVRDGLAFDAENDDYSQLVMSVLPQFLNEVFHYCDPSVSIPNELSEFRGRLEMCEPFYFKTIPYRDDKGFMVYRSFSQVFGQRYNERDNRYFCVYSEPDHSKRRTLLVFDRHGPQLCALKISGYPFDHIRIGVVSVLTHFH
jgi:hypothetical protein